MHVFDWLYISLCRHRSVKLTWCISACLLSLPFVLSVCMCASAEVCGMDALTNLQIGCFMSSPRSSSNSLPPVLPLPHWMCVCVLVLPSFKRCCCLEGAVLQRSSIPRKTGETEECPRPSPPSAVSNMFVLSCVWIECCPLQQSLAFSAFAFLL